MKSITLILAFITTPFSAKALPNPVAEIRNNIEVKSIIEAVEKNRNLECEKIDFNNTKFEKNNIVKININCTNNEDQDDSMKTWTSIEMIIYKQATLIQIDNLKITQSE